MTTAFSYAPNSQSTQMNPGGSPYNYPTGSQYNSGGRSDLPEADTRYDFGNGQPLNLSPRDYPSQRQPAVHLCLQLRRFDFAPNP